MDGDVLMYYVYWYHLEEHTDITSEGYIGITKDIATRKYGHNHAAFTKKLPYTLYAAMRKHGEAIQHDVLCVVEKSEALRIEKELRPKPKIGWNMAIGGGDAPSPLGRKHSKETREKIGKANRGKKRGPSPFKGKSRNYSDETKALIGSYHKGKTISQEHKDAMSLKSSGANNVNAKEIYLVHKSKPTEVKTFPALSVASRDLGIPYSGLRSLFQQAHKQGYCAGAARGEWVVLLEHEISDPSEAIESSIRKVAENMSKPRPNTRGAANHKAKQVLLENREGVRKQFGSIGEGADYIGINEATLRHHIKHTVVNQKDSNFNKTGWKVIYTGGQA